MCIVPKHNAMGCWECLDTKVVQIFKEEPDNLKTLHTIFVCLFVCLSERIVNELSNSENFKTCIPIYFAILI